MVIHISNMEKKGILTLVRSVLDPEEKRKLFGKISVSPFICPCAKFMCTKTKERVKIVKCGFFLFEMCILEIETAKISNLREDLRR